MNIFILDNDFNKCVEYYVDKHVVKMILETTQLLLNAHEKNPFYYKKTHYNHPCSKWVRKSAGNYIWLCNLGKHMCKEYTYRYEKVHKCEKMIDWCNRNIPKILDIGITEFVLAMPNDCKSENAIDSYRCYYNKYKQHIFSWKKRNIPDWITK